MRAIFLTSDLGSYKKINGVATTCEVDNRNNLVNQLNESIEKRENFVFVASNPSGYSRTDSYAKTMFDSFKMSGVGFERMIVLDDRTKKSAKEIIKNAMKQAISILKEMNENRNSFRKMGLTFEEKAFYDILIALRDQYNFEYGTDKEIDGILINDKCKLLAQKVKKIIDQKSIFADWLNNQNIRNQLKLDIKICLIKNGYPPQYSPEVFSKVMEQVENFEENNS